MGGTSAGQAVGPERWRWKRFVLAGLVAGTAAYAIARAHESELIAAQFDTDATLQMAKVDLYVGQNLRLLRTFGAFFASSEHVDRGEFAQFAMNELSLHPSLRSAAWAPRIAAANRARHEQAIRGQGVPDYTLFECNAQSQRIAVGDRDPHYPLTYVEPARVFARNLGFDLASKPERVTAMARAIELGAESITYRIDVHAPDPTRAFVVAAILPVTNSGLAMATAVDRRAHTVGFVQIDFSPMDLVAMGDDAAIRLTLDDVTEGSAPQSLFDQRQGDDTEAWLKASATIHPGGRTWRMQAAPTCDYVQTQRTLRPGLWAAAAAALALLVGALIESFRGQTRRVEVEVAARTRDLVESEARYRALFDGASDLIVSVSPEGRIELANRAWADSIGDPAAAGRGRLSDLVPRELRTAHDAQVRELLLTHDTREMAIVILDAEGRQIALEGHARVRRVGDRPIAIQAILRNVTERRRLEQALEQREESLRAGNKTQAVSQLAGGLAHEFNNLLTTISGFGQFLAESLAGSPDMKQDVDEILVAAERGSQLTRQLLMFTHQQPSKPEPLDLNSRLTLLLPTLRLLTGRGVQLSLDLDPEAPWIEIDRSQLEQVIINLVSNARDALTGGGTLEISTRGRDYQQRHTTTTGVLDPGRYVVVSVRDSGEGIAPEAAPHLFEPFYTTRTERHAPGLGLSIAYSVVSQAGGGLSVESAPGKGTTVSFHLPRTRSSSTDKITRQTRIGGARILLAEDEPQVRQMTSRILRQAGFEVVEAADGVEALVVLEREAQALGLLVTDVVMPNMGGAELARRAAVIDPALPVIFVSGYTAQGLDEHGALRPGCELVHKPFSAELFLEKVREKTRAVVGASQARYGSAIEPNNMP